jgi:GT2 family glycosyltransferase
MTPDRPPRVSVVCSTYGRAALLPRLVRALARQTMPPDDIEVLIVDNGSEDETWEVLQRLALEAPFTLRTLRHARNRGAGGGRNTGWRAATAPIVAFTDDDCAPAPAWLEEGVRTLELHGPGALAVGRTSPDPDEQHLLLHPFSRTMLVAEPRFFETCNIFYWRDDLHRMEGFDERFGIGGEDTDLALRLLDAGHRALWSPEALVHHCVRRGSLRANLREARRWVDVPLVIKRHPSRRGELLHRRWFWKRAHPPTIVATAGLAIAAARRSPLALALVSWWLWHRLVEDPPCPGPRRRVLALPGTFLIDVSEVATMLRGSARHRTVIL